MKYNSIFKRLANNLRHSFAMHHSKNAKLRIRHIMVLSNFQTDRHTITHHTIIKRDKSLFRPKYKSEATWICENGTVSRRSDRSSASFSSRDSPFTSSFSSFFSSLTPRNSLRSETRQNELQRNRDNTSLYKVVARWWGSPIQRCCPIWHRSIVPPSCSTPTVVSRMNN